jgi:hypothetical protein
MEIVDLIRRHKPCGGVLFVGLKAKCEIFKSIKTQTDLKNQACRLPNNLNHNAPNEYMCSE